VPVADPRCRAGYHDPGAKPAQRLIPVERAAVTRRKRLWRSSCLLSRQSCSKSRPAPFVRPCAPTSRRLPPYWMSAASRRTTNPSRRSPTGGGSRTDGSLDQQGAGYSTLTSAPSDSTSVRRTLLGPSLLTSSPRAHQFSTPSRTPATAGPTCRMSRLSSTLGFDASISTSRQQHSDRGDSFVS